MRKQGKSSGSKKFGNPGRRTRATRERMIDRRAMRPRILIVCEGGKTEPNYFLAFKVTNDVYGRGLETIRVVEEAIRLNEKEGPFDQVWCVFDKDDFPADDFDNAIKRRSLFQTRDFTWRFQTNRSSYGICFTSNTCNPLHRVMTIAPSLSATWGVMPKEMWEIMKKCNPREARLTPYGTRRAC